MDYFLALSGMLKPLLLPAYLLLEVLAVLLAFEAIFKSRTSQGAISWALALIFLSPVVVPLYLVLGERRFHGYVAARRQGDREIQKNAKSITANMAMNHGLTVEQQTRYQLLEALALMPFTHGNAVDLFIDGEQAYREMFAAIGRAQRYILLQFYIVRNDAVGQALADRLIAKAEQGVKVYFLFDKVGSFGLSASYIKRLKKAGVEVKGFQAVRFNLKGRFQVNFRNHRKLLLIDGKEAIVGGFNIGEEYCHKHAKLTPWRDTQIYLQGPAVLGVQLSFLEDWYWLTRTELLLDWEPESRPENVMALSLPSGPADEHDTCHLMFVDAINRARKRIWIVSPYFVPDGAVTKALKLASFRGVDVKILMPGITDNHMAQFASYDFVDALRNTQVEFYRFQKGFLHQKVMLLDDDTSYIGTANLDNRSFHLNFELTVVVVNKLFNQKVESMLRDDLSHAELFDAGFVRRRNLVFRLLVKIARLFAPLQ